MSFEAFQKPAVGNVKYERFMQALGVFQEVTSIWNETQIRSLGEALAKAIPSRRRVIADLLRQIARTVDPLSEESLISEPP